MIMLLNTYYAFIIIKTKNCLKIRKKLGVFGAQVGFARKPKKDEESYGYSAPPDAFQVFADTIAHAFNPLPRLLELIIIL